MRRFVIPYKYAIINELVDSLVDTNEGWMKFDMQLNPLHNMLGLIYVRAVYEQEEVAESA